MQADILEQEAPTHVPTTKLSNGVDMPLMGFGTWQLSKAEAEASVRGAVKMASPASIDTSPDYRNHDAVKAALRDTPRDSYFLTTKVNPTATFTRYNAFSNTYDQVRPPAPGRLPPATGLSRAHPLFATSANSLLT